MNELQLFIPIVKVDAARRLVYGVATAEIEDRSGEICDYATTKPYYEKWSGEIEKATGGKSLGNLRAMHGHVAAGKVTSIAFNDDAKQIEICAKVVDDAEWKKVEEGVYTGFSQGGAYVKRWTDGELTRYTADPVEVSLVDLPCLPDAMFSMIKADGLVEERAFKALSPAPADELAKEEAKATVEETPNRQGGVKQVWVPEDAEIGFVKKADALSALQKAAIEADTDAAASELAGPAMKALDRIEASLGIEKREYSSDERKKMSESGKAEPDGSFPIKDAADVRNAVRDWGRAGSKESDKKHIIARAKAIGAESALPNEWTGAKESERPIVPKSAKAAELAKMACGEVMDCAMALQCLDCLYDLLAGEQGSDEPPEQCAAIRGAIAKLKAFIVSEIQEDGTWSTDEPAPAQESGMAMAAEPSGLEKAYGKDMDAHKAGLMNIKRHANDISRHAEAVLGKDESMAMSAGADADGLEKPKTKDGMAAHMEKVKAIHQAAAKIHAQAHALQVERDLTADAEPSGLEKTQAENTALRKSIDLILARLKKLEDEPMPLPLLSGKTRPVSKTEDAGAGEQEQKDTESLLAELSKTEAGREKLMMMAIKAAHANPQAMKLAR